MIELLCLCAAAFPGVKPGVRLDLPSPHRAIIGSYRHAHRVAWSQRYGSLNGQETLFPRNVGVTGEFEKVIPGISSVTAQPQRPCRTPARLAIQIATPFTYVPSISEKESRTSDAGSPRGSVGFNLTGYRLWTAKVLTGEKSNP